MEFKKGDRVFKNINGGTIEAIVIEVKGPILVLKQINGGAVYEEIKGVWKKAETIVRENKGKK